MEYDSVAVVESREESGVCFRVNRMSFARRVELMRRIRELAKRMDFLESSQEVGDRMDAGLVRAEVDRIYVQWGLAGVSGLTIDGEAATPEGLAERGPEGLFREALEAVRSETGLTEEQRKN